MCPVLLDLLQFDLFAEYVVTRRNLKMEKYFSIYYIDFFFIDAFFFAVLSLIWLMNCIIVPLILWLE